MSRKDALLRLHQRLTSRRETLRDKLNGDKKPAHTDVGDLGDVASEGATSELNSQLASLETRELRFCERVILMIREGRYGICEQCDTNIPIARLQALPFSVLCVNCQRDDDEIGGSEDSEVDWSGACEYEGRFGSDREITIDDLNIDR
jgi:DnaK suppressor protein